MLCDTWFASECRSGQVVVAHHQPRLVAIQQTPEDRPGDDAGEVEAEDDEAYRRTRAGQLQHETEQGDDGELVPEIQRCSASLGQCCQAGILSAGLTTRSNPPTKRLWVCSPMLWG
jgi:hypothetical protein